MLALASVSVRELRYSYRGQCQSLSWKIVRHSWELSAWLEGASKTEQVGKGKDASMGRTSWEGWQAEIRTPPSIDPERAPAEVRLYHLKFSWGHSAGARSESKRGGVLISACHPSQLVRPTEESLPPFPTCSGFQCLFRWSWLLQDAH